MCYKFKLWLQKAGLPWEIIVLELGIFLFAAIGCIYDWQNYVNSSLKNNISILVNIISPFAVVLTLGILIIYTYYTYLLAKYQIIPSASFELKQAHDDPYHFGLVMINHGKYPVECWCNLNATTRGEHLVYGGFYSGGESRFLKPRDTKMGHFRIDDLLMGTKYNIAEFKNEATSDNFKQLLHLNIEFKYCPVIDKNKVTILNEPYYFDFRDDLLKLDF
jgi:hypothetical protein